MRNENLVRERKEEKKNQIKYNKNSLPTFHSKIHEITFLIFMVVDSHRYTTANQNVVHDEYFAKGKHTKYTLFVIRVQKCRSRITRTNETTTKLEV